MPRSAKPRVLLIDDGERYAEIISERMPELTLLRPKGSRASRITDGPAALRFLQTNRERVDLVLLDMKFDLPQEQLLPLTPAASLRRTQRFQGTAILRRLRQEHPNLPVVMLSTAQDIAPVDAGGDLALQAMTYFLHADDLDALRIRINGALQDAHQPPTDAAILWGRAPAMAAFRQRLSVVARGPMPVILEGETGTGKSYLARRFIHARSGRHGPFVALDLSTVPTDLVAAQLFGATRGAYTGAVSDRKGAFQLANGGTLFIDEIQNVPLEVQRQLLLVLENGSLRPLGAEKEISVDVKVIAASNASLNQAVSAGRFRPDLYMRLCPATAVTVPTLRERADDLALLAESLVRAASQEPAIAELIDGLAEIAGGKPGRKLALQVGRARRGAADNTLSLILPAAAWRRLEAHRWPGNLRELKMVLQNVVTFTLVAALDAARSGVPLRGTQLQVDPGLIATLLQNTQALTAQQVDRKPAATGSFRVEVPTEKTLNAVSNAVERQYLQALYRQYGGDFSTMAERLLGDTTRGRAVRLRFNQLGLKAREQR